MGEVTIEEDTIDQKTLLYLGCRRHQITVKMKKGAKILLIGGEPFAEEILIWWNFVARSEAELAEAVIAWEQHTRFGEVVGYESGIRMTAPKITA